MVFAFLFSSTHVKGKQHIRFSVYSCLEYFFYSFSALLWQLAGRGVELSFIYRDLDLKDLPPLLTPPQKKEHLCWLDLVIKRDPGRGWAGEGEEGLVRVKLGETGRAGKGGWRQARREMAEAWTGGQLPSQAGRAGVSWGPGAG